MKIWTIADEHKLYESFPRFVADYLSRVPFVCADGTKEMSKKMAVMEERLGAIEQLLERAVQPDGGLHQRNVKKVPKEVKDTADEVQPETAVAASWDMPRHCRQPAAMAQSSSLKCKDLKHPH